MKFMLLQDYAPTEGAAEFIGRDRGGGLGGARTGRQADQNGDRGARSDGRPDARAVSRTRDIEDLLRDAAPRVLAAPARRLGDFADAEDATQEAMLAATQQWPRQGTPENPVGWLIHVASLRVIDRARSDSSRRDREAAAAAREPSCRVPRPRGNDGSADQSRQADDQGLRDRVPDADRRGVGGAAAARSCTSST
jgi:Sigma-70 region 2